MDFVFHPDRNAVVVVGEGRIDIDEVARALAALAVDERFSFDMHQIFDLRGMTGLPAQISEMEAILEGLDRAFNKGTGRIALIIEDELGYGLGRMFVVVGEDTLARDMGIFRSLDDAFDWFEDAGDA